MKLKEHVTKCMRHNELQKANKKGKQTEGSEKKTFIQQCETLEYKTLTIYFRLMLFKNF